MLKPMSLTMLFRFFHPTHTTTVNKHFNTYIPHTRSIVKECYSQSFVCGVPQPPSYSRRMLRY
ncbi:CotD family spore coat protein [Peribacillus frigoritolerans]|nr:CotD family spore coat protein [Peribacillus frigoritolerans]